MQSRFRLVGSKCNFFIQKVFWKSLWCFLSRNGILQSAKQFLEVDLDSWGQNVIFFFRSFLDQSFDVYVKRLNTCLKKLNNCFKRFNTCFEKLLTGLKRLNMRLNDKMLRLLRKMLRLLGNMLRLLVKMLRLLGKY